MGAITQAMASSARARGVDIRTEAEVTGALLDNGRIEGVRLASGEEFKQSCCGQLSSRFCSAISSVMMICRKISAEGLRAIGLIRQFRNEPCPQ